MVEEDIIHQQRLILARIHELCSPIGEKDGKLIYPDVPQKDIDDLWEKFNRLGAVKPN